MPGPIPIASSWRLTGRVRVRPALFGRLVVQVEEEATVGHVGCLCKRDDPAAFCSAGLTHFTGSKVRWRDAAWYDRHVFPVSE